MNAKEKWALLGNDWQIIELQSNCTIPLSAQFFTAIRSVTRGLEEHIVLKHNPIYYIAPIDHDYITPIDHDFAEGHYLYMLQNPVGQRIYIKFDGGTTIFGSSII